MRRIPEFCSPLRLLLYLVLHVQGASLEAQRLVRRPNGEARPWIIPVDIRLISCHVVIHHRRSQVG